MTRVLSHPHEDLRVRLDTTQERVAAGAQEAPHATRRVAVVDEQVALDAADQAAPILGNAHRLDVLRREPVLPFEACALILRAGRLGVRPTPLPETFVPASLVRLAVLPGALVRAGLAVGVAVSTRAMEVVDRLRLAAGRAPLHLRFHASSVAWPCDTVQFDLPCHADVLLDIANSARSQL